MTVIVGYGDRFERLALNMLQLVDHYRGWGIVKEKNQGRKGNR